MLPSQGVCFKHFNTLYPGICWRFIFPMGELLLGESIRNIRKYICLYIYMFICGGPWSKSKYLLVLQYLQCLVASLRHHRGNGNLFRSLTLLAVTCAEQRGCELKDVLTAEAIRFPDANWMTMVIRFHEKHDRSVSFRVYLHVLMCCLYIYIYIHYTFITTYLFAKMSVVEVFSWH